MISTKRRLGVILGVVGLSVLLATAASGGLVLAEEKYDLEVPGATETPTQTETVEGTEYEVDSIAHLVSGEPLDVDVTAPDGEWVDVYLYDSDQDPEETKAVTGSESVTFETGEMEPGNYALALYVDGNHVEIVPVVIEAYDVSIDHDEEIDVDEDFEATIDVTKVDTDDSPEAVEIVLWNDGETIHEEATKAGDGEYTVTVPSTDLDTGTYQIYGVARGSDTVEGENEVLGVAAGGTVEVKALEDDDDDSGSGIGSGGGSDGSDDESDDDTDGSDDGSDKSDDEIDSPDDGSDDSDDETNGSNGDDSHDSESDTDDDDQSVISPNTTEDESTGDDGPAEVDDDDETPGFGISLTLFVLLSAAMLALRR